MRFVKTAEGIGSTIYTKQHIRMIENTSIPEHINDLEHMGYSSLNEDMPTYDIETHNCTEAGWGYIGGVCTVLWELLPKTQEELEVIRKRKVPTSVAMWQARDILIEHGMLDDVETFMNSISDPVAKARALSKWEFSNTVQRNDPLVNLVCASKGWSSAQIDDLFIEASKR